MTLRGKLILATIWGLSLVTAARWSASAQVASPVGQEVRFMRSDSDGRGHRGILVANFGGQWLPVTLDTLPDANELQRVR